MNPPDLSAWYHHNLNPIAVSFGDIHIPWYWLVYICGWFWCAWVMRRVSAGDSNSTQPAAIQECIDSFLLWGWIALLVGSRLTYILVYNPSHYLAHPDQVLALWNGGMSFHGGFLGVVIAAWVISRKYQISIFRLTDPVALAIPIVLAFGRLANFANGELPGRVSMVPWAVVFPAPFDGAPRHPSQLYEALGEGLLVAVILFAGRRTLLKQPGFMSFAFTGFYAVARFFIEFTREPDPQMGLLAGLTMGQWLCAAMMALALVGTKRLVTPRLPER
jgi:phosphatidylglycerol:prolipoprotein diacylglycerol transferase